MPRLLRPIILAAVLSAACGDDNNAPVPSPPDGYPYAYAYRSCGPTDGPATSLELLRDSATTLPVVVPLVAVRLYRASSELQGRAFSWSGSSAEGWGGRCDASGTCEEAVFTSVRFRDNAADTVLTGTLELRFRDGTSASGGFDATWKSTGLVCG
jgi:hypothetical protein